MNEETRMQIQVRLDIVDKLWSQWEELGKKQDNLAEIVDGLYDEIDDLFERAEAEPMSPGYDERSEDY